MKADSERCLCRALPRPQRPRTLAALFVLAISFNPSLAVAQFMYLDTDGDGVYSPLEPVSVGGPTTIDVYLVTNRNYDSTPVTCWNDPSQEPGLNSYTVNLYSLGSSVTFTDVVNLVPGMFEVFPPVIYPYALSVSYAGSRTLPPGTHHLLRMTATFHNEYGCPAALTITTSTCYSPPGVVTAFGAGCSGVLGDDYRLGEAWTDTGNIIQCTDLTGRPPVISCPPQVTGRENEPINFAVSVMDPDCEVYSFFPSLTGGAVFSGLGPVVAGEAHGTVIWTPRVGQAGIYPQKFEAYEPIYFPPGQFHSECTTQVTVLPSSVVLPVRVFTTSSNQITRLPHGKPSTCFQIEPLPEAPFAVEEIVPSSLRLRYQHATCGQLEASPTVSKIARISDTDQNGISEFQACFSSESLGTLVSCDPPGRRTLPLEVWGALPNGDRIRGAISHTFISGSRLLGIAVSPNPLGPTSALQFVTTQWGFATARLFDVHGRLVGTLVDAPSLGTGFHRIPLVGFDAIGVRLATGVFFVRLTTEYDGSETRAVMVLK